MKIKSIDLENIRSYESQDISLGDGLISIYGENGAGKSSLIESIFGGLYLSDALKYTSEDINLDSLIRKGEDEGRIKIKFSVNNCDYEIEWVISVKENNGDRQASTKKCILRGDKISEPYEGVRAVREAIVDIIGMNTESFVNSVYVQQGDITRMVNADDEKRREIIDGLLGLSKLDRYIDRMDKTRLEFGSQRRRIEDLIREKENMLGDIDNSNKIEDKIQELNSKKDVIRDNISELQDAINSAYQRVNEIDEKIERANDLNTELGNLQDDIEEMDEKKNNIESKIENLESEIDTIKTEREFLEENISNKASEMGFSEDINTLKSDLSKINEKIDEFESNISRIRDVKIKQITNNIETKKEKIDEKEQTINELENEREQLNIDLQEKNDDIDQTEKVVEKLKNKKENIQDKIDQMAETLGIKYNNFDKLREKIPEFRDKKLDNIVDASRTLGRKNNQLDNYEELVENQVCPICNEEHNNVEAEESIHNLESEVDNYESRVDAICYQTQIIDKLEEKLQKLNKINNTLDIKKSEIEQFRSTAERIKNDRKSIFNKIESHKEDIENYRKEIGDLNVEKKDLENKLDSKKETLGELKNEKNDLEQFIDNIESKQDLDDKINQKEKELDNNEKLRINLQEQYLDKKSREQELQSQIEDINESELRDERRERKSQIDEWSEKKEECEDRLSEIQEELARKKQQKSRVEDLKKKISDLQDKKRETSQNEKDAESVIESYKNVKTELRKENIGLLNKYANEIFNSVYKNKTYKRLQISEEYNITLITGDGVEISPENLSGGEKTIVSLSIRAGVYKLLVERNGNADTLPPFILDEPTTYLDDSHISNLQNVIDKIKSWDVSQILVVSHREDMIQNANHGYHVEKDPSSGTSSVSKVY